MLTFKTDPKQLQGLQSSQVSRREFFWDSLAFFVFYCTLGLTVIDVVTEAIRGSAVECYMSNSSIEEAAVRYIRSYCYRSLPPTVYFSVFIVISGVLITIPHYLWLNHYGGNFDFFFSLASRLDRLRNTDSGEHTAHNNLIVQQLETAFGKRNIFGFYIAKLCVQWVTSFTAFMLAISYFTDFHGTYFCPLYKSHLYSQEWPFGERAVCVFTALRLLWGIRIVYILLLLSVISCFTWALLWCWCTHTSELGSSQIAQFAFSSGIQPHFYVPKVPRFCHLFGPNIIRYVTALLWFSRPGLTIHSDLDFMIMKLFRADRGLGYVMKDVQVARRLQELLNDNHRHLNLHYKKHTSLETDDVPYDREYIHNELKWLFKKKKDEMGIYFDFKPLRSSSVMDLPTVMHGAVLAFGGNAPNNGCAISVSFGSIGYATALARVFQWVQRKKTYLLRIMMHCIQKKSYVAPEWVIHYLCVAMYMTVVGSISFNPHFGSPDRSIVVKQYYTNIVHVACKEDILAANMETHKQFILKLKDVWVPPNQSAFINTTFVVVGPIDKDLHLTTVELLLEHIAGCLAHGAVLLLVRPLVISGKCVKTEFLKYRPAGKRFTPLNQEINILFGEGAKQWMARSSNQSSQLLQSYSAVPRDNTCSVPGMKCGTAKCVVEFTLYKYTNNPPAERPVFTLKRV